MKRQAFSIVELLIVMAILGVVLGIATVYFVQSSELGRRTQARSEVQDKVKAVMQLVTQDLLLAGSSQHVSGGTVTQFNLTTPVLSGSNSPSPVPLYRDTVGMTYATSLRPLSGACRRVEYTFPSSSSDATLRRSDVLCGGSASNQPIADNILALDLRYVCSNNEAYNSSAGCPLNTYARSARVIVVGRSNDLIRGNAAQTLPVFNDANVTCPADYICFRLEQEVLLPNLKN